MSAPTYARPTSPDEAVSAVAGAPWPRPGPRREQRHRMQAGRRDGLPPQAQGEQRGKQPEESHGVTLALPGKCRVRAGVGPG